MAAAARRYTATRRSKIDNPVQVGQNTATSQPSLPDRRQSLRKGPMEGAPATLEAVDIAAILKALPHRYPFLMVDRIINMRGDESAVGIKNVTVNEPQFLGHFPGNPVFPGVLIVEGMAQTAGTICLLSQMGGDRPKNVYFLTIDKAKFRKPVVPGDTVEYHVAKIARKKNMWWFRGEAKVAGELVAEAVVGAMVA
jgi:3-hydroxyacyl-[acyl-carrier-protein] dehydratase